jgi:hypothetical protein
MKVRDLAELGSDKMCGVQSALISLLTLMHLFFANLSDLNQKELNGKKQNISKMEREKICGVLMLLKKKSQCCSQILNALETKQA